VASFDELTHFDEVVFWYMLSRLRSTCGVKPYLRATCNPEVTSWVRDLISWWVDERTGFPIPERGGVVRWFVRTGDKITWGSSKDDPAFLGQEPLSFTFIPAKVTDNPALLTKDPDYLTKLRNLPAYERATLLEGNWNVRLTKGMIFQRERFGVLPAVPADVVKWVRYWDRGATEPSAANPDPDATSGTLMGRRANGRVVVAHECNLKVTPHRVLEGIKNLAAQDPEGTEVWLEQDPGQAGVAEISYLSINLAGFDVRANKVTTSKLTRAKPFASQVELGNVDIVKGPWNEAYLQELEAFVDEDAVDPPPGYHDDRVDSSSGAYNALMSAPNPRVR
jgi:predicted phage terminase large subunit-like protein